MSQQMSPLEQVAERSLHDPEFFAQLKANPDGVLAGYGISDPEIVDNVKLLLPELEVPQIEAMRRLIEDYWGGGKACA